jgi:hypothetical protein
VVLLFSFRQFLQFEGRIPQDSEKDSTAVVLAVGFAQVSQVDHFFRQLQGFYNVKVAGSHGFSPRLCLPVPIGLWQIKFCARKKAGTQAV